jgi:hypothetical protein
MKVIGILLQGVDEETVIFHRKGNMAVIWDDKTFDE